MFLKGPVVLDRGLQRPNPCPDWLPEGAWDGITELDKNLAAFQGLAAAFEQSPKEWRQYYNSDTAESEVLPGEWEARCSSTLGSQNSLYNSLLKDIRREP